MMFLSRTTRHHVSPKRRTVKPRLEPLDERQLLSGFGPADGAYIVEPWGGSYEPVQIQPGDQKIVVTGDGSSSTGPGIAIARYDSLGNPDDTYGTGTSSIPPLSGVSATSLGSSNPVGTDLVLQTDGKALVAGWTSPTSTWAVARFNTDGSLDSGFGNGGWNNLDVSAYDWNPAFGVGLQSTGKIVVAGFSQDTRNNNITAEVARFTAGGAVDSGKGGFGQVVRGRAVGYTLNTFGSAQNEFVDLAVQPDDKLVAVGSVTTGTGGALVVARYTASGTLDTTFGGGSGYSVFLPAGISSGGMAVALQVDGKIIVTGGCTSTGGANDLLVARYNTNGTLDTSFGGGSGYVTLGTTQSTMLGRDVAIQPDGKIVVAGRTSVTGNPYDVLVARFNVDGTPDATFAPGGYKIGAPLPNTGYHSFSGFGVALQSNGNIIVAGDDNQGASGGDHPLLMRFFPTTASPLQATVSAVSAPSRTEPLTPAHMQLLRTGAIGRLPAAGPTVSGLGSLDVLVTILPATTLDPSSGNTISPDSNAADWGWSVVPSSRGGRKAHPVG
jgi:uncharacterized delta-60 repeat protein